jgi:hypothetical protein
MFDLLSFTEKPKQTKKNFLALEKQDLKFKVVKDEFVSENMKQYGWFKYDKNIDDFYRTNTSDLMKKCPRIMTKVSSTIPQNKFSKITTDKEVNKIIKERIIDKVNTAAGKKVIISETSFY